MVANSERYFFIFLSKKSLFRSCASFLSELEISLSEFCLLSFGVLIVLLVIQKILLVIYDCSLSHSGGWMKVFVKKSKKVVKW